MKTFSRIPPHTMLQIVITDYLHQIKESIQVQSYITTPY